MQIMDITNPKNPVLLGNYPTSNPAELVAASGNRAFVVEVGWIGAGQYGRALHIIDVTNPASPNRVGLYETSGGDRYTALVLSPTGEHAFLTLGAESGSAGRLEVIDLRTPATPSRIAVYDTASIATGLAILGEQLLVGQSGLVVLNVSDPANPQPTGSSGNTGWINRIAATGPRAYATGGQVGFQIFDLSNPAQPQLLGGSSDFGSTKNGLTVSGGYVYGAAAGSGVQVIDVSNPTDPRYAGGNSAALANDLAISGNHLFVAADSEGLQVFDLALGNTQDLPALGIARSGSSLTITWPASVTGAVLETTRQLAPTANWSPAAEAPVVVGDQNVVTIQIGAGSRFFRLKKP
jgi:hypothetical protein